MAWYCKATGGYGRESAEALANAQEIYAVLSARGWTVNAVCGLLGNIHTESGYNPWRWQSDKLGASGGSPWRNKGYGLTQFTPASKYIDAASARATDGYGPNFSNRTGNTGEGYAQLVFVDEHADYYATSSYPLSYAQFKQSTESAGYLARAWLYNYERPADPASTEGQRASNAEYWYGVLSGETPPDPDIPDPPPGPGGSLKYWMMFQFDRWRKQHVR